MLKPYKFLLITLGVSAALILATIILVIAALSWNSQDESLRPEAEMALTEPPALPPPDAQNSYFAMLGFWAAPEEDIWTAGMNYWLKVSNNQNGKPAQAPATLAPTPIKACDNQPGCLIDLAKKITPAELGKQRLILERYQKLRSYPSYAMVYADTLQLATPQPHFDRLPHALWQVATAQSFLNGDIQSALQEISIDLHFWQLIARQADNLKLLASAHRAMQADYQLLADLAAHQPAALMAQETAWSALLSPTPKSATNFKQATRGEAYRLGWALRDIPNHWGSSTLFVQLHGISKLTAWRYGHFFYKPKASVNLLLGELGNVPTLLAAPIDKLLELKGIQEGPCGQAIVGLRARIDNISGRTLVCANLPDWLPHGIAIKRTEAWRRLLLNQKNAIKAGKNQAAIAHLISTAGDELKNPMGLQAVQIDGNTLIFAWPDGQIPERMLRVGLPL